MADIDFSLPPDAWTSSKENVGGHIEPAGHFFVLLFSKYFRFISCVSYFRGGGGYSMSPCKQRRAHITSI
jgi:hypothetical protein